MSETVFDYTNYRSYMNEYYQSLPKGGRGELTKTAQALNVQPSLLTGILQGSKNLTTDQAIDWAAYAQMTALESKYFLSLVNVERAGTPKAKKFHQAQVDEAKDLATRLKNRIPPSAEMSDTAKAQFYSEWYYSAIRLLADIPEFREPQIMAEKLGLKRSLVIEVLDFLLAHGLIKKGSKGYELGAKSTHVGDNETLVNRHHVNWRLRAVQSLNAPKNEDLHFTSTVTISSKDVALIRKKLMQTLDEIFKTVDASASEELSCICLDWFNVVK